MCPHKPQEGHSAFVVLSMLEMLITVTAASPDAAVSSTAAAGKHSECAGSFVTASAGLNASASCNSLYSQKQLSAVNTPYTTMPPKAHTCAAHHYAQRHTQK